MRIHLFNMKKKKQTKQNQQQTNVLHPFTPTHMANLTSFFNFPLIELSESSGWCDLNEVFSLIGNCRWLSH